MAYEEPNRFVEWCRALKEHVPTLRRRWGEWINRAKEDPELLWATPAVRYVVYGTAAMVIAWGITFVIELLTPPPPPDARPQATTADFHVVCENPACRDHFVINREFGFDDFPVICPKCKKETGRAARPCNSSTCQGKWVIPKEIDGRKKCPVCGHVFP